MPKTLKHLRESARRAELERMPSEHLDKKAWGHKDGAVRTMHPDDIHVQYHGDVENPEHQFKTHGMKWAHSVKLHKPIDVHLKDDGKHYIADGHHRWFAAKKTNRSLKARVHIKANSINKILKDEGHHD